MNLIAMIGIVEKIKKENDISIMTLKVEKPFFETSNSDDDFFDSIDVSVNTSLFSQDLNIINSGTLVGLKGRIKSANDSLEVVAEKIQVF